MLQTKGKLGTSLFNIGPKMKKLILITLVSIVALAQTGGKVFLTLPFERVLLELSYQNLQDARKLLASSEANFNDVQALVKQNHNIPQSDHIEFNSEFTTFEFTHAGNNWVTLPLCSNPSGCSSTYTISSPVGLTTTEIIKNTDINFIK